jgi:hypothetical protein
VPTQRRADPVELLTSCDSQTGRCTWSATYATVTPGFTAYLHARSRVTQGTQTLTYDRVIPIHVVS